MKIFVFLLLLPIISGQFNYEVDDTPGLGRQFDGIGGLSGGGVSMYFCTY